MDVSIPLSLGFVSVERSGDISLHPETRKPSNEAGQNMRPKALDPVRIPRKDAEKLRDFLNCHLK